MNKYDLVSKMAETSELTKKESAAALDALLDTITDTVRKGDRVTLVGFGTFSVINRKARKGRNPHTGKELIIPSCNAPKFTPGKNLKDSINN